MYINKKELFTGNDLKWETFVRNAEEKGYSGGFLWDCDRGSVFDTDLRKRFPELNKYPQGNDINVIHCNIRILVAAYIDNEEDWNTFVSEYCNFDEEFTDKAVLLCNYDVSEVSDYSAFEVDEGEFNDEVKMHKLDIMLEKMFGFYGELNDRRGYLDYVLEEIKRDNQTFEKA